MNPTTRQAIIQTSIIQKMAQEKPLGFCRSGGMMRYYMNVLAIMSQSDWYVTLDYCLSRGWLEESGQTYAEGRVYNWRGKQESKKE